MKYILIAEDEIVFGKLLEKHLLTLDCHVLHVTNGAEAISCIRQSPPDLLILDLIMPVMNGFEVLEAINARDDLVRPSKIVVLSNLEQAEDIKKVQDLGADEYIGKSQTSFSQAIATIKSYIEEQSRGA